MSLLFILLLFFDLALADVAEKTPDQLVKPMDTLTLTCVAENHPISFCSFVSPSGQRCGYATDRVCPESNTEFVRSAADVDANRCTLRINNIEEHQNGEWKCEFKRGDENMDSMESATMIVTVAKEADVDFSEVFGTLDVIAGNHYKLSCQAKHGRPSGKFRWSLENSNLDTLDVEEREFEDEQNFFNVVSTLDYVADKNHNGQRLLCHYDQFKEGNSEAIYSPSDEIELNVFYLQPRRENTPDLELYNVQDGQDINVTMNFEAVPKPKDAADVMWIVGDVKLQIPDPWDENGDDFVERRNFITYGLETLEENKYSATLTIKGIQVGSTPKGELRVVLKDKRNEDVLVQNYNFVLHSDSLSFDESSEGEEEDKSSALTIIIVALILIVLVALIVAGVYVARQKEMLCFERRGVATGGSGAYARP